MERPQSNRIFRRLTSILSIVHSIENNLGIFMLKNFGDSIKSQYVSQRIDEMRANGMSPITQGECPVCLDQKVGYTLSCNDKHFLCCQCFNQLLEAEILANGKIKCPMCRAQS